jgi:hypothetical protein
MLWRLEVHLMIVEITHACNLVLAGLFLDFLFDSEDGGDMFLQMSVDFQRTTWRYIPEVDVFIAAAVRNSDPPIFLLTEIVFGSDLASYLLSYG